MLYHYPERRFPDTKKLITSSGTKQIFQQGLKIISFLYWVKQIYELLPKVLDY
jgi:hypothetical protein